MVTTLNSTSNCDHLQLSKPALRPALPCVYGPLDYREQRALIQRIDSILSASGLEEEFIALTLAERAVSIHSATAARTLMKATVLIRKHGLKHRMPQDPLDFLRDMNTLCMKMSAKNHAADGRKHRKKVLREMKNLGKHIVAHARAHVEILKTRRENPVMANGARRPAWRNQALAASVRRH